MERCLDILCLSPSPYFSNYPSLQALHLFFPCVNRHRQDTPQDREKRQSVWIPSIYLFFSLATRRMSFTILAMCLFTRDSMRYDYDYDYNYVRQRQRQHVSSLGVTTSFVALLFPTCFFLLLRFSYARDTKGRAMRETVHV